MHINVYNKYKNMKDSKKYRTQRNLFFAESENHSNTVDSEKIALV